MNVDLGTQAYQHPPHTHCTVNMTSAMQKTNVPGLGIRLKYILSLFSSKCLLDPLIFLGVDISLPKSMFSFKEDGDQMKKQNKTEV